MYKFFNAYDLPKWKQGKINNLQSYVTNNDVVAVIKCLIEDVWVQMDSLQDSMIQRSNITQTIL